MARRPPLRRTAAFALALTACTGIITEPGDGPGGADPRPFDPGSEPEPVVCDDADLWPDEAPLRRLTPEEYAASVRQLFPGVALPDVDLARDATVDGFDNNATGQTVSPLLVEQYATAAAAIGAAAAAAPRWLPCDAGASGCGAEVARTLGRAAYRRPLSADEATRLTSFFELLEADLGFDDALAGFIEGLLQSPMFLYRPEAGDPALDAPDGFVALSGHEVATRLAYTFLGSAPDEALRRAAEEGRLATAEGVEAEARRLLADPRARQAITRFHRQWLKLDRLQTVNLSTERFPELTPALLADLRRSIDRFLEYVFFEDGHLETLLTSRVAFVNDRIAPIFGVTPPGSADDLVQVELPAEERAGIMTQPALLASTSHGTSHSPILRGVLVLDALLCAPPPPPPRDLNATLPEDSGSTGGTPMTTRERVELSHGTQQCAVCHDAIDGMGFTFERYDALGRFRMEENGMPVDPTGTFRDAPVDGAVALAERFERDRQVSTCLSTQWLRYSLGRSEDRSDACAIQALTESLAATGGDLREMVLTLVTSPSFRFRPGTPQEVAP